MTGGWQLGIDIGGTFTDVVAFEPETGELRSAKARSRPDDPLASLLDGLRAVGVDWDQAADLVHGTTVVTNAIVEGRLAKVALVATVGFADTLAIGRQNRRHLYRLDLPPKAPPLVPEDLRFEIAARSDPNGQVTAEPSDGEIAALAAKIAASGAEAVAVALLHAYANPELEERIGAALRKVVPQVALSHRVNPEAREYERTSTTALSAGVMPLAARHLDRLEQARPSTSRLHMFHSAGGMAAPAALRELDRAIGYFSSAIDEHPGHFSSMEGLNVALELKGQFDEALERAEWAAEFVGPSARQYVFLARELEERGDQDDALLRYRQAVAMEPDNATAHAAFAKFLLRVPNEAAAVHHLLAAYKIDPNDPWVLEELSAREALPPPLSRPGSSP